jgi:hypothetical protein
MMDVSQRHPATQAVVRWFKDDHLPPHLRQYTGPVRQLAETMLTALPDSPDLTRALDELLHAKDGFVRAAVAYHETLDAKASEGADAPAPD